MEKFCLKNVQRNSDNYFTKFFTVLLSPYYMIFLLLAQLGYYQIKLDVLVVH